MDSNGRLDSEESLARHPGRRKDDPKGLLYYRTARRLILGVGGTGATLAAFVMWFLLQQWNEKAVALAKIAEHDVRLARLEQVTESTKADIAQIREDVSAVKRSHLRFEDKIDAVLMSTQKIDKRTAAARRQVARLQPGGAMDVLVCRNGFDIWIQQSDLQQFLRDNRQARMGTCP